jgi:aspartyl-tRNA(Asn)/glutamyl-tRNA(Gln) amidotransferase subunit B
MRSADQAVAYMRKVHSIVRYLGICDGNMQEGSFRCDANVSLRPMGESALGTRTELKNLNSFRYVERAILYEIHRQAEILDSGGTVVQETRLYDADRHETRPMRSKEEAEDYRYFPDPDLLPVVIDDDYVESVRRTLPELPDAKGHRFIEQYALSEADAEQLTASRALADFYEAAVDAAPGESRLVANWMNGELAAHLNKDSLEIQQSPMTAQMLAGLMRRMADGTLSGKMAKEVFEGMWQGEGDADQVIQARGLEQLTDSGEIERIVDGVLGENPAQVEQFRAGREKVLGFFVGRVMKATSGKADPARVNEILRRKLAGD